MPSRTRLRALAPLTALIALLAIAAPAWAGTFEHPLPQDRLERTACVEYVDGAELPYVTHWGYINPNDFSVERPVGPENGFAEEEFDKGQPETFLPGEHRDVFTTASDSADAPVWVLDYYAASVNGDAYANRCASIDLTEQPAATTESTTAKFSWQALVNGFETEGEPALTDRGANDPLFTWQDWRDRSCTLDGVEVDCAGDSTITFANLAAGSHTFEVKATPPCLPFLILIGVREGSYCVIETDLGQELRSERLFILGHDNRNVAATSYTWTVQDPAAAQPQPQTPVVVQQQQQQQAPRTCVSRRSFSIRIREFKTRPIRRAAVRVNGKLVKVTRKNGRLTAKVNFATLPKGRFTVKITARFRDGAKATYTRRYRTCAPKLKPSNGLSKKTAL